VYKVDTGLLAELRAHEQQAAQELSQWQTQRWSRSTRCSMQRRRRLPWRRF
jgi:hypothetical protein